MYRLDWSVHPVYVSIFQFSGTCVIGDSCFNDGVDLISIMAVELMSERYKYLLGTYQVDHHSVSLHMVVRNVQDMEMIYYG